MRSFSLNIFLLTIITLPINCLGQDSAKAKYTYDWSDDGGITMYGGAPNASLIHQPQPEDVENYKKYKDLINKEPDKKNYYGYYTLAVTLWTMNKLEDAERLLLKIVHSKLKQYSSTHHLNSDIPGDTSSNLYGYGSYDFNFKNEACIYLARVYLEKKEFEKAYKYTVLADSTYKVYYNCGTGTANYNSELGGLYSACYEGLKRYKDMFQIEMPYWYSYNSNLTEVIKNIYSRDEINKYLDTAESTLVFKLDSTLTTAWITRTYGGIHEYVDTIKYRNGTATMRLFGCDVDFPEEDLKNRQVATRDYYVMFWHKNRFYRVLRKPE